MEKIVAAVISALALVFISVDAKADSGDLWKMYESHPVAKEKPKVKVDGVISQNQHTRCQWRKDCVEWNDAANTLFKEKGKYSRYTHFEDGGITYHVFYYDSPDKTEVFVGFYNSIRDTEPLLDDFVVNIPGFVLTGLRQIDDEKK